MNPSVKKPQPWMRWSLLGALSAVAVGLIASLAVQARAQAMAPAAVSGASGGVYVAAGRISGETYGLYLVDHSNRTISVYQVDAKAKTDKLRLMASRTYAYDVQLDDFNTTPSPREIQQLVEQHRRLREKE